MRSEFSLNTVIIVISVDIDWASAEYNTVVVNHRTTRG